MNSDSDDDNPFAFLKEENKNDPVQKSIAKIDDMFHSLFDYYDEKKHPSKKHTNDGFNVEVNHKTQNAHSHKYKGDNIYFEIE